MVPRGSLDVSKRSKTPSFCRELYIFDRPFHRLLTMHEAVDVHIAANRNISFPHHDAVNVPSINTPIIMCIVHCLKYG